MFAALTRLTWTERLECHTYAQRIDRRQLVVLACRSIRLADIAKIGAPVKPRMDVLSVLPLRLLLSFSICTPGTRFSASEKLVFINF